MLSTENHPQVCRPCSIQIFVTLIPILQWSSLTHFRILQKKKQPKKTTSRTWGLVLAWPARCGKIEGALLASSFQMKPQTTLSMVPSSQTADLCHRQTDPLPVEAGSEGHLGFVSHIVHGRHAFHTHSQLELNHYARTPQHLQNWEL